MESTKHIDSPITTPSMYPIVDPNIRNINNFRRQERPIDSMYYTAFSAEIIDQTDLQRGQEPEETFTDNQNDQDSVASDSAESVTQNPQQEVVTDPPRTSSLFNQGFSMFQGMARRRSNTARSRGHSEPRLSVNTTDNQTDSKLNRDQRGSVNITDDQTNVRLDQTRSTTPVPTN